MTIRKVVINGSDKIVCKYFDNGYCRFGNDCKFWHSEEVTCSKSRCENVKCLKRHPKPCSYFRRRKCKFAERCKFKHDPLDTNDNDETLVMTNKIKALEEANKNLKKDLELKVIIIQAKDEDIKTLKKENQVMKSELDERKKQTLTQNMIKCKKCTSSLNSEDDLKKHMLDEHKETDSTKCPKCDETEQMSKKRVYFMTTLQEMCKSFVKEKKKHKEICDLSRKCPHEETCVRDCYFVNDAYVESEQEDSEDDLENETDETDSDDDQSKVNQSYKCNDCNYKGNNVTGLKMHMKSDHKIRCDKCGLKTTTIALLKKHLRESH